MLLKRGLRDCCLYSTVNWAPDGRGQGRIVGGRPGLVQTDHERNSCHLARRASVFVGRESGSLLPCLSDSSQLFP